MSNYAKSIIAGDMEHILHPTSNLSEHKRNGALVIERGQGVHVFDVHGKEYIEGMAGLWCTSFGFSEQELVDAAIEQMQKLPFYHGFGNKAVVPTIDLAARLKTMMPFEASKVFFTNSGSEANDTQLKIIWYYNNAIGKPKKKKIIARWGGYHGVTIATACLTGLPAYRGGFDQPLDNILHISCPHYYRDAEAGESEEAYADRLAEELEQLIQREDPDTIAAFIAEPIMAGGGVIPPPKTYFEKIDKILKKYDIICIADEVVCGFGRTGNMFGCETVGMKPDTMTIAKQLSSAYMPIAAVIIPDWMYEVLVDVSAERGVFGHGYTYGGHPVPAAVALRNLELFEERNMLSEVRKITPYFQNRLREFLDHPLVGDARGAGLIGAIELVADKANKTPFKPSAGVGAYCDKRCIEHGLIHRFSGNAALFCPPLIISADEIDEMFRRFELALDDTLIWARESGRFSA